MKKQLTLIIICCLFAEYSFSIDPPQFKFGAGGGVNFSKIADKNSYPVTDINSGDQYTSEYSKLLSNPGYQFFLHGELAFNGFNLALKPGYYNYRFSKTDEISSGSGTTQSGANYSLGYLSAPLEAKWFINWGKNNPYIGGEFTYGYLLRQGGNAGNSFRRSRFSAGPVFGINFELQAFDLVFSSGYDIGLNRITRDNDSQNIVGMPYSPQDIKLSNLHFSLSVLFDIGKSGFRKSLDCPKIQRQ
jgi:hypothetical protein